MTTKVTHYEGTVYYHSCGSSHTKLYPFLEEHAYSEGVTLDEDGIDIEVAKRLIAKWNRRRGHGDVSYRYYLQA